MKTISFLSFLAATLLACKPKVADKETAQRYEQYIFVIIEPLTSSTAELNEESIRVFDKVEREGNRITQKDSLQLFEKFQKCDSIVDATISKLLTINEPEEIVNYDDGQLKKLAIEYSLKTKRQIEGPLYKLITLYALGKGQNFDSLKAVYADDYGARMDSIKAVTREIQKLPYYQID